MEKITKIKLFAALVLTLTLLASSHYSMAQESSDDEISIEESAGGSGSGEAVYEPSSESSSDEEVYEE